MLSGRLSGSLTRTFGIVEYQKSKTFSIESSRLKAHNKVGLVLKRSLFQFTLGIK
jgi:hypothetical protein